MRTDREQQEACATQNSLETLPALGRMPPEKVNLLLGRVVELYAKSFAEAPEGCAFLERRGIADAGLFSRHRVGYAAGNLKDLLPRNGPLKDDLKSLGILLDTGQERFEGCVVFPVYDADGNLTTLCGHVAAGRSPNTDERHLLLPERPSGLWNAPAVKMYPKVILVKSVIDGLSVMVAGYANVIAVLSDSRLSDNDIALFKACGVSEITLLVDGRESGGKAVAGLRSRLSAEGRECVVKALPAGHDPNRYLVEQGAEKLAEIIASTGEPSDHTGITIHRAGSEGLAVTYGLRRYDIRGLEKGQRRLKATIRAEHAGRLHVDTLDFYSARSRRLLAQDLCRMFDESPETIEADIDKLLRHCESLPDRVVAEGGSKQRPAEALSPKERGEAEAFGRQENLFDEILADYEACGLVGEQANKLLCYLAMTSRKMEDPLSVLILSSSGAGKSVLQDSALAFCPPEDLIKLTSLSGKALFYKEPLSLRHKTLALEEGVGAEQAAYAIRNLITARELVIETAYKNPASGKIATMTNRVKGPTAVFLTTAEPDTDPETRSRFFVLSIDESREQTRAILAFQRRHHTLKGLMEQTRTDAILLKHRNFQRLLRPIKVVNSYADRLGYGDDRLQGRRDQPKYLNLIKTVAFLRQMRKPVMTSPHGIEYLEVDLDDIRFANKLAGDFMGRSLEDLSGPGRELLLQAVALIKARREKERGSENSHSSFTRREIREFTGWAQARLHRYLKELTAFEYLLVESGRNGLSFRLAWDGQPEDRGRFMLLPFPPPCAGEELKMMTCSTFSRLFTTFSKDESS